VFYVNIFFRICLPSTCRMWYFHCDLDFRIVLFQFKLFSSSLILVFLIWFFLVWPAALPKTFYFTVSVSASFFLVGGFQIRMYLDTAINFNSMVWVCERTIPTKRPPLVGEAIANLCG
jgi:hypothetical protein